MEKATGSARVYGDSTRSHRRTTQPVLPDSGLPALYTHLFVYPGWSTFRLSQWSTFPLTNTIVRPRLVSGQQGLQLPSAPWRLTTPSAPACSARVIGIWVLPIPRPGLAPGFPRPALGVRPQDPFRVAQPSYFPFHGVGVRSKEGFPSSAAFGAAPARISPGTRLTRLSPSGWRPLGYSSGPGTTGLELKTSLRGEGSPGQGPGPNGNLY